jgi:hypothetical protein
MKEYKNIEAIEILVRCRGGAVLNSCIHETIVMALEEDRRVRFIHNDRVFIVNPKDLIGLIYRQHETAKSDTTNERK